MTELQDLRRPSMRYPLARLGVQMAVDASLRRAAILAMLALLAQGAAHAGGAYLYEIDSATTSLASAGWTARAEDAGTIFSNPAGMARLGDGGFQVSLIPLYLDIGFSPDPTLTTASGAAGDASSWLPFGGFEYVRGISDKVALGLAAGGYFGLALDYEDGWVGRYYVDTVQLQALTIEPAISFRASDRWSFGLGAAVHYGIFRAELAINNTPIVLPGTAQPDGKLEIDTDTWAVQANLGVLWEPSDSMRFGLQYLSESSLDFTDTPEFTGLRPALETALGAAGILDTPLDVGMTMPQAVRLGSFHVLSDDWDLMADIGWEEWSRFGMVEILLASDDATSITADRNYEDVWHAAIGARKRLTPPWELRFGLAYDTSMVEDVNRTPDLPLGASLRLAGGAEYKYSEKGAFAFGYELAWGGSLAMDVERGPLAGRVAGEYPDTAIHFLSGTWRKVF
jgi:long-chain fatty acid transport protein